MQAKKIKPTFKKYRRDSSKLNMWIIATLGVLFVVMLLTVSNLSQQQHTNTLAAGVNPMIFGTNLTLMDATDQFVTSAQTRAAMQQIHVQTIRMPIRAIGAPSAWEIQAAQDIKAMNAIPLVILKYSQTDPKGAGISVVQAMNQIFGSSPVYYEFGNERDINGADQVAYTTQWNLDVAAIKAAATNGKFGGPVTSSQNPAYISYFVKNAIPKPDFISWHEYTCGNSSSGATCIANIAHWSTHIANIKAAIQANGDTVPPMFITEWNYDAVPPAGDTRPTAQFQQTFAQTALQELAKDGVAAAYHFVVTGSGTYQLIDSTGQLTPEGQSFGQTYSLLGGANTPSSGVAPSGIVPSFVCAGSQTSICISGNPTPTPGGTTPSGTMPYGTLLSPAPSSGQVQPSILPSAAQPVGPSGIVLPSIPQMNGTPPTGAARDALHKQIDEIERQLDALEKKVSDAIHKQIDVIERQIDAFEKWLLSGGKK